MDQQQSRDLIIQEIHAYQAIIRNRGEDIPLPDIDDGKVSMNDLAIILRKLKDLARTPT